ITSNQTGPIWTDFMRRSNEARGCGTGEIQARPEGIKEVTIDLQTGRQADDKSGSKKTDMFPSWYKPEGQGQETKAIYDVVSGKLATECTPERAKEERTASGVLPEIPPEDPSFGRWSAST